jgi:anti-sigma factor ChrR (cupin superfamily)
MTRCDQEARVQEFLDGDLPPDRAAAFRAHLAVCPRCAAAADSFRRLIAALEQDHLPACLGEAVGRGETGEASADDHGVYLIVRHYGFPSVFLNAAVRAGTTSKRSPTMP